METKILGKNPVRATSAHENIKEHHGTLILGGIVSHYDARGTTAPRKVESLKSESGRKTTWPFYHPDPPL
jgi:hypothetical protein